MRYTKDQLTGMDEFEVNTCLVAKFVPHSCMQADDDGSGVAVYYDEGMNEHRFDLNNPSDIMPLAFERKIDLIALEDGYAAEGDFSYLDFGESDRCLQFYDVGNIGFKDSNPLRAIACLLLLMEN